jgi:Starch-binding associating with outer membrane/Susd and RagB outer membrane lipoprotein
MKYFNRIIVIVCLFAVGGCRLTDLDANLENPNEVPVSQLDVNALMNKVQMDFADFVHEANIPSLEMSRMRALINGDTYERSYQAQDLNSVWVRAYQDVLVQIETMLGRTDGTGFTAHSAIGRTLKAYTYMTLVDMFGDVPFAEASKGGSDVFNPAATDDKVIYDNCIALLDEAIALFATAPGAGQGITRDIYYSGNATRWTALCNTLKLKAYINLRLTDSATAKTKIEELLTKDLIDSDGEEFKYEYGTADLPTRSRHPLYRDTYQPTAGAVDNYLGNFFLKTAYDGKGFEDPRWRYYFYRQFGSTERMLEWDSETIPCYFVPAPAHYPLDMVFCSFNPGFFGRDHGNNDGIPPDEQARTVFGVYPAGGRPDVNTDPNYGINAAGTSLTGSTRQGQGANGGGFAPIWMASFTEFAKAEAALTLGTTGDPKVLMSSGINKSIARVKGFAASKNLLVPASLDLPAAAYVTQVEALYDAAASDDARLNVILTEYYIALWGNGIEAHNMYRRTGKPGNMQPMRNGNAGIAIRSFPYPADYVNLNSAARQKQVGVANKVFWDNNPDDFIK